MLSRARVFASHRLLPAIRRASTAGPLEEHYSTPIRVLHWGMAAGTIGCFATVKLAQYSEGDRKGELMRIHKSFGLLMLAAVVPRVAIRIASKVPKPVPGPAWEAFMGELSHKTLYAMMLFMPISGVIMGYFGGKGLPFFAYNIPGAEQTNPDLAKAAFKSHKLVGQAFEILVPLHIGAVGYHMAWHRQNLLKRIL